ncbi:hypothetical protein AAAZ63_05980 [Bacteroides xylanisolvens]|uniref:hypothetical protein n=1 Tax=Bacteroides xylanisolvens TaxID=371601 RepID=UPI0032C0863D
MDIGGWINGAIANTWNIASGIGSFVQKKKQLNKYINFQREENQKTRDYNLNLAKQQNQWNIDQWNRENEYNTPAAQMARYKQAGLNPDLMYGQQNLSAASPEMTAGEPGSPMDYSPVANGPTIGEAASIAANARLTNAQAKLAESQADKVDAETIGQTINNDWLPKLLKGQVEINEADVKQKLADAGLKGKQIEVAVEQIKVMQQSVKESQAKIKDLQSQMENRTFQQVQAMLEYNLKKDKQSYEVREILSRIGLNHASVNRIVSLLPYEISTAIATADNLSASAALGFLKQGTEMIIQQNLRLDGKQKEALIRDLNATFETNSIGSDIWRDGDGNISYVGRCFYGLSNVIKALSPFKSK